MGARVYLTASYISLRFGLVDEDRSNPTDLRISCQGLDWQVSHLAEVLSQSSAVLPKVHHLAIYGYDLPPRWQGEMDDIEWLALFRQFTAVEALRIYGLQTRNVAHVLNDITVEMVPDILPALRLLFLEVKPAGGVEKFITTRQLAGLPPIVIANTVDEYYSRGGVPR